MQDAISLSCRLGFAKKKNAELDSNDLHPSWYEPDQLTAEWNTKKANRY